MNIFLFDNFFKKSSIFWENREKLFWGCIWQFFRERRRLALKINITFLITNHVLNILLLSSFFKRNCNFLRNGKKPFLGPNSLLKRRGRLATKMNITFFMGNELLNNFSFNNFFEKINVFGENEEKNILWLTWPFFWRRVHFMVKINITFLIEN